MLGVLADHANEASQDGRPDHHHPGPSDQADAAPLDPPSLALSLPLALLVPCRQRRRELGAPQRRLLRLQPSLSAGSRGGQAGLVLDLRF